MFAMLLAMGIAYTLHAKDIFQPPKPPPADKWSEPVPRREALEFQTTDGTKLRGWLYRSDTPDAAFVLFFYGSNEDMFHEANRLAWLSETLHVNAVCFDYPGYGFSGGTVAIPAFQSAALQEFDYVKKQFVPDPATPIIAYGWSIGTSMAIHVAANRHVAGLILQAPPASADEMMRWSSKHDVPWYGRGLVKMKADRRSRRFMKMLPRSGTSVVHFLSFKENWMMSSPSIKVARFWLPRRRRKSNLWQCRALITMICNLPTRLLRTLSSTLFNRCDRAHPPTMFKLTPPLLVNSEAGCEDFHACNEASRGATAVIGRQKSKPG